MVAKLKLKGIDGRAPPGVEPGAASSRLRVPGLSVALVCNVSFVE